MSSIISLREWIKRALDAVDLGSECNDVRSTSILRHLTASSGLYLTSALRIARSLADQLCEADESANGHHQPMLLPSPGTDWADRVVVHLSNSKHKSIDDCTEDLEPLSHQDTSLKPNELHALLTTILSDLSPCTGNDVEDGADINAADYHSVVRAEISPIVNDELGSCKVQEIYRIYNLGIVFYELFSGGDSPPGRIIKAGLKEGQLTSALDFSKRLSLIDDSSVDFCENVNGSPQPADVTKENIKPCKKRATGSISCTLSSLSMDSLKLRGMPASLCHLIGNMLDSMNGDLGGDEAYTTMSDVRSDLQLMLDKPNQFLYDMDCEKLAVTGLQLNESVFDRENDYSDLQSSFRRSLSGENECGVIVGPPGIGKTVLANRLGNFAYATGALFLKGKFDQLQQVTPFSALASALNDYHNQMLKEFRFRYLEEVAPKLKITLGKEAWRLLKVIPSLSIVPGEGCVQDVGQDSANAQAQIQHLLCLFVDVISSSSGAPIVLFLDDLQWSDQASLSAINQLLLYFAASNSKRQFFFLGSCREDGLLEQHPFGRMLANIRQFGVHTTVVKLDCIDKDSTNTVVSDLLCLWPRLTRPLSDIIYHYSKGNPLFISQLMISLCRDGLLRLNLKRRRWEWDEEKIQSITLPDDVAAFLSSTIKRLSKEVQSALCTLSCFGARTECVLVESLESNLGVPLIEPLQVAVSEGIVDNVNGSYSFGHDKLQEAAYNLMQPEDRCLFHFNYGLALVNHALELNDDGMLFTAANQINLGGPVAIAVKDSEQAVIIANLNLTAGIKAMEMSDFSSAFSYFDHGITFLPRRHWKEHYELTLQLFEAACKCALVKGDAVSLNLMSDQILRFARKFEDKLNALFNNVTILSHKSTSKLPEAVDLATSVLSQLGIELPESSESDFKTYITKTETLLQGFTDKDLTEYKTMTDPSKIMAMKFLARLEMSLQYTKPAAVPGVTMKMISLSIDHGMSPVSSIGFVCFGQHVATCGNIEKGCRYVNIARKLQDRIGSNEFAGEVIAMGSQLSHFVEPIHLSREYHAEGYTVAMASGDIQGAMLNRVFYSGVDYYGSSKLIDCKKHLFLTCRLLEQHGHSNLLVLQIQFMKNTERLIGMHDDNDEASKSTVTAQVEEITQNVNRHGSMTFNFQKMYIHFMFREYDEMKVYAEQFFRVNFHSWLFLFIYSAHKFYGGLVAFWVYRQTNDFIWAERGLTAKAAMNKWAQSSQHNFQHRAYLLEAEEAFCNNDTETAQILYEKAVSTAREHQ